MIHCRECWDGLREKERSNRTDRFDARAHNASDWLFQDRTERFGHQELLMSGCACERVARIGRAPRRTTKSVSICRSGGCGSDPREDISAKTITGITLERGHCRLAADKAGIGGHSATRDLRSPHPHQSWRLAENLPRQPDNENWTAHSPPPNSQLPTRSRIR